MYARTGSGSPACPTTTAAASARTRARPDQGVSGVLCASASRALPTTGRTVWFDRGDNRPTGNPGGEFASGNYKGQCSTDEYAAGIAFTGAWAKGKTPDALLCRKL